MANDTPKRHLITAALPYANGKLHIGHLAGCYLPADIYVRFLRSQKKDVKFICASDEHGIPITIKAIKENKEPKEVVDFYHNQLKNTFDKFGVNFDIYSRTSSPIHHKTAQDFFLELYKKNAFEEIETENFYDPKRNIFLADRYIIGTCPKCSNPEAYGDQCEKCGSTLSTEELINPKSTISNETPIKKKTKHWYLSLGKYEEWLQKWFSEENTHWKKNVLGQCKGWIENGLKARAMTRDAKWGVKVPLENTENKVLYVWFDAPIGYISATKELTEKWEDYWCSNDTELIHFIGKDNIVFHCIIFPVMLKEHGNFILPRNVPANEFLNLEGNKISTSRNYAVWVDEFMQDFPEDNIETMRYVLCSNLPENKDNDFTWKDFQDKHNNELVSILSNFVYRTLVLIHKLCSSKIPQYHTKLETEGESKFIETIKHTKEVVTKSIEQFKFREAIYAIIDLSREGNKYMQIKEPWILAKNISTTNNNQKIIDNCLYLCIQSIANLSIYLYPFLPKTSLKICRQLKVIDKILEWNNGGNIHLLKSGYSLRHPEMLFQNIEDNIITQQIQKLEKNLSFQESSKTREEESLISFEDFAKLKLVTGSILEVTKIENTEKLYKLLVDIGTEKRTIVSGIAEHFTPEQLIGKQVCVVKNLEPKKIKGVESYGMLLLISDTINNKLVLLSPERTIPNGQIVH